MHRIPVSGVILWAFWAVFAVSCSKGSDSPSPTEPAPVTQTATLPGRWTGTLTVNRSGQPRVTCSLEVVLQEIGDPQTFLGTWTLQCPDGARGGQQAVALILPLELVSLNGFPSTAVLDGCSWGGLYPRQGKRLTGDWAKPSNPTGTCQTSPIQGGTVDLTKAD